MATPTDKRRANRAKTIQLLEHCCRPGFYGKVEIFFEDGEIRGKCRLETTIQPEDLSDDQLEDRVKNFLNPPPKTPPRG